MVIEDKNVLLTGALRSFGRAQVSQAELAIEFAGPACRGFPFVSSFVFLVPALVQRICAGRPIFLVAGISANLPSRRAPWRRSNLRWFARSFASGALLFPQI